MPYYSSLRIDRTIAWLHRGHAVDGMFLNVILQKGDLCGFPTAVNAFKYNKTAIFRNHNVPILSKLQCQYIKTVY